MAISPEEKIENLKEEIDFHQTTLTILVTGMVVILLTSLVWFLGGVQNDITVNGYTPRATGEVVLCTFESRNTYGCLPYSTPIVEK